ncbi:hypothetical protein GCM10010243_67280 [Streptomyces matensis]|nr:hypothetical protein GCM10010243_67280 [Streptomyces matensis]
MTARRSARRQGRAAKVQASIAAAVNCPLCPELTAEAGIQLLTRTLERRPVQPWWSRSEEAQERAQELTGDPDWRERALSWIDAYRDAHGHGPSWQTFWRAPHLWPTDATASMLNNVMRQLRQAGLIDGTRTPYGLRRRTPSSG